MGDIDIMIMWLELYLEVVGKLLKVIVVDWGVIE